MTFLDVCEHRGTGNAGRDDFPLLEMEAAFSDHSGVELDAGMCGGVVSPTASTPHFLPLWCQVVIPTLSQVTIIELRMFFI